MTAKMFQVRGYINLQNRVCFELSNTFLGKFDVQTSGMLSFQLLTVISGDFI